MIRVTVRDNITYEYTGWDFDPNLISNDPWNPTLLNPLVGVANFCGHILLVGIGDFKGEGSWSNNPYSIITSVQDLDTQVFLIQPFDAVRDKFQINTTMTNSNKGWILRGGDWWSLSGGVNMPPLENGLHQRILDVIHVIGNIVDVDYLLGHPRMLQLVRLHGNGMFPRLTAGKNHDAAWLQTNWKYRTGEPDFTQPWALIAQRGAEGWNNCHYDSLLWSAFAFMIDQTSENWLFGYQNAVLHSTRGRIHTPGSKWQGRTRYEKGFTTIGDWNSPSWAKQWSLGLLVWAYLSMDPLLMAVVNESFDKLLTVTPQQAWDGAWGERIGANWLHEVVLAYKIRLDEGRYKTTLNDAVNYFLTLRNAAGWWPNIGNNGTAPASPWMASKLIHAMWLALDAIGEPKESTRRTEIVKSAEAIHRDGFYMFNGVLRCRYRFPPHPEASPVYETPAQVAISLPMYRILAYERPETYADLYYMTRTWLANNVGVGWSEVSNGLPAPNINDVGIEYPRQGLGWVKAVKMYLHGSKI